MGILDENTSHMSELHVKITEKINLPQYFLGNLSNLANLREMFCFTPLGLLQVTIS